MKFNIKTWGQYRQQARYVAKYMQSFKDECGVIQLQKKEFDSFVGQITSILEECSEYMDKCGLTMKPPLWNYDHKDPRTHMSSKEFAFGHLVK